MRTATFSFIRFNKKNKLETTEKKSFKYVLNVRSIKNMQGRWAILAEKCQACKMLSRLNKRKHSS